MKNKSYIGISFIILIFGIIFIPKIIDRISDNEIVKADRLSNRAEIGNSEDVSYVIQYDKKKKVPEFEFVNQEGDTITNEDMLGKVYVIDYFFTTCPSICPIMKENLIEVQEEFKNEEDFGIVSITIDPKHDTPQVLKQYAEVNGIKDQNWHFLTGKKEEIYEMANTGFGILAGEDVAAEGGFVHSGMFALIDKEGYVRSRLDKFGNPIIYYRGFIEEGKSIAEDGETSQINILIEDTRKLL